MSSFYDDASLVVIPSGYKTSKIYAEKPTDGSGDLTFTRASGATRVASNGLIEKVRTNLLTYSQDFSNAAWIVDAGLTKTLSQTDPNGGTTAALFSGTSGSNLTVGHAVTLTANVPNTISIWIKGSASGSVSLRIDDSGAGPQYDINYTTSWQRFSVTKTVDQSSCVFVVGGYFTWGVGENIYLAFGQAETGDIATDYIPTTTAAVSVGPVSNVPRLDYLGSSCPRLLLEPQRTNLITYSEQLDNAAWSKTNCTIAANAVTSPDGYQNADNVVTAAANSDVGRLTATVAADTTTYTQSGFFKWVSGYELVKFRIALAGGTAQGAAIVFNARTGAFVSSDTTYKIENYGNGWFRVSHQITNNGTNTALITQIYPTNETTQTQTISAWGFGMEAGSYATSYIPTLGASVTRVADAASKENIAGTLPTAYPFTLYGEAYLRENNEVLVSINDISNAAIYYQIGATGAGFFATARNAASSVILTSSGRTEGVSKVAAVFTSSTIKLFANGVLIASGANAQIFNTAANDLLLGQLRVSSDLGLRTPINQALVFKSALTDAQAIELTTL